MATWEDSKGEGIRNESSQLPLAQRHLSLKNREYTRLLVIFILFIPQL